MALNWLDLAKQLQALAQAGLEFTDNKYDIERYQQIRDISIDILHHYTQIEKTKIRASFAFEKGYQTPKVDIRGVVFRNDTILLVKETLDDKWSIPGGWADIGLTPKEVAIKEVKEESGLEVETERLLAALDKRSHGHPPDIYHIYKLFFLCKEIGGRLTPGMETSDVHFFGLDELPPLSIKRVTQEQIKLMFELKNNPNHEVVFD